MNRKAVVPKAPAGPRRPPQFPLSVLLGLMVIVSIGMAPAFYLFRGEQGMQLAGMLIMLAGPLLLVALVSSLLAIWQWLSKR